MGASQVRAETNSGIISTGERAVISQSTYHLPVGGVRQAHQVECPAGTVHLGPGPAGGGSFVGRDGEFAALDAVLAAGSGVVTPALTGLGGIGKSTLAREYARRHRGDFNPIWWIPAADPAEIEAGLARLARHIQTELALLPDAAAATWARAWLGTHDGWLLLLDDVTDPVDVADLVADLPAGRFLLTSRATFGWDGVAVQTRLGVLTDDEAELLFRRIAGDALAHGAAPLLQLLGNLPLAIHQAASYMRQNQVTAAVYLTRLAADGRVLDWSPDGSDSERTIARIWQVGLKTIADRHGDLPGRLVRVLAWCAPDDIPVTVLYHLDDVDEQQVDEALGRLAAYALITRTGDALALHRLVQTAVRAYPDGAMSGSGPGHQEQRARYANVAAGALFSALPEDDPTEPAAWPGWRRLIPHIEALAATSPAGADDQTTARLFHQAARFLGEQGAVKQVVALARRAHADRERLLGPDHVDTLKSLLNLACAHTAACDLDRAIALHQEHLDASSRVLGPDDELTMSSRNQLANAYQSAGRLDQAISLYRQALDDCDRVLGTDCQESLAVRNNLAVAYESVGDLGRAIPLMRQNLDDCARLMGADHPDTLAVRNNLAVAYREAGDHSRAIPLYEQNLEDRLRVLGPDHPDTLSSRRGLANGYAAAGDLARAIPLYEQSLADHVRVLGPDHPHTMTTQNHLAIGYLSANDLDRAIPLFEQNLADRRRLMGPDHPSTLVSQNQLAVAYESAGDLDRAMPLFQQSLDGTVRVMGPDHPNTLAARTNAAVAYRDAGDLDQAILLYRQNLDAYCRASGLHHPTALHAANDLACAYSLAGDLDRAIPLLEQTLTGYTRLLGPEHRATAAVRANLEAVTAMRRHRLSRQ